MQLSVDVRYLKYLLVIVNNYNFSYVDPFFFLTATMFYYIVIHYLCINQPVCKGAHRGDKVVKKHLFNVHL